MKLNSGTVARHMTVLDVIQRSAAYLAERGVDSARLQAELLLAHVLKLPRLRLYLSFDRVLTEPELAATRDLVKRRGQRVPLQHLTGSVGFLAHDIKVTGAVLVPRPETETLAQLAIERLQQLLAATPGAIEVQSAGPRVLDFGTGSGCLAIALAAAVPAAEVHALDVSAGALALARVNAAANGVGDRITFHEGDGFAALGESFTLLLSPFTLIVTNPPYIPSAEIATLDPEVRDHDPRLALDGGPDGLDYYRRLAAEAPRWLTPDGWLLAEFGDGQAPALAELFAGHGWRVESVEKDLSERERVLIVRPPRNG